MDELKRDRTALALLGLASTAMALSIVVWQWAAMQAATSATALHSAQQRAQQKSTQRIDPIERLQQRLKFYRGERTEQWPTLRAPQPSQEAASPGSIASRSAAWIPTLRGPLAKPTSELALAPLSEERLGQPYPTFGLTWNLDYAFEDGGSAFDPLACLQPSDWVRPVEPSSLVVLLPESPQWTAHSAARHHETAATLRAAAVRFQQYDWRSAKNSTVDASREIGRWLASNRETGITRLARPLFQQIPRMAGLRSGPERKQAGTAPLLSPPGLKALVGTPSDRLAMVPNRDWRDASSLKIRHRVAPRVVESAASAKSKPTRLSLATPEELQQHLSALKHSPQTVFWAGRVERLVELITSEAELPGSSFAACLRELSDLGEEAMTMADAAASNDQAVRLRWAGYAIERRVSGWELAHQLQERQRSLMARAPGVTDEEVRMRLQTVLQGNLSTSVAENQATRNYSNRRQAWREYLMTQQLAAALEGDSQINRQELAHEILNRIASQRLTVAQKTFINAGAIAELGEELQAWARETADVQLLMASLEAYESERSPRLAQDIALQHQSLGQSVEPLHRKLAMQIEQKYRNANLRLAIATALMERFLPAKDPTAEPVRDRILGAAVRGRAVTSTRLSIRTIPSDYAWQLGLQANGVVQSHTISSSGPAQLINNGATTFEGQKVITVRRHGVAVHPAVCQANASSQLVGIGTTYDDLPMIGGFIRSRAKDEYRSMQSRARVAVESRVNSRVTRQLDEQVAQELAKGEAQVREKLLARAERLGLDVTPIELRTTDSRVIGRLRLANDQQLAAHTPRNRAPSDSYASLQLHESAINNALAGLDLAGQTLTAGQLRERLQERLDFQAEEPIEEDENAEFHFAQDDPATLHFIDGKVQLVLNFDGLKVRRLRFGAFKVHVYFQPESEGLQARLRQTAPAQFEGRLRMASRMQLHGIFGKVLPEGRAFPLVKLPAENDPRLQGLMVTQLIIDGGWMGLAIGPETPTRTAQVGRYVR